MKICIQQPEPVATSPYKCIKHRCIQRTRKRDSKQRNSSRDSCPGHTKQELEKLATSPLAYIKNSAQQPEQVANIISEMRKKPLHAARPTEGFGNRGTAAGFVCRPCKTAAGKSAERYLGNIYELHSAARPTGERHF